MGFFAAGLRAPAADHRPVVGWEEPRCLLCQGHRGSILIEAPDPRPTPHGQWFAVTQCQDCGLCYTSPRPDAESMGQFDAPPLTDLAPAWHRLEQLPRLGLGRLLDFGCGQGDGPFLQRMQRRGWKVTGLALSESAGQRLRAEAGLPVLVGSLPHPELGDASFDLITMRHALPRVPQPLEVLRAAHRLLGEGGQLVASAPNIDSLPFQWFGRYWRGLDLPRHLSHFTPDTLQLMLARAGFDVGPARMLRDGSGMRRSARFAARHPDATRWQRRLRGRFGAALASWYAWLVRRCDAVMVTAVKGVPVQLEPMPAFSPHSTGRPRSPADRWRNM
jgi:SAM-dependent methyltransferase